MRKIMLTLAAISLTMPVMGTPAAARGYYHGKVWRRFAGPHALPSLERHDGPDRRRSRWSTRRSRDRHAWRTRDWDDPRGRRWRACRPGDRPQPDGLPLVHRKGEVRGTSVARRPPSRWNPLLLPGGVRPRFNLVTSVR